MKKISIVIVVTSLLIGFYSFSNNTMQLHNVAQVGSINKLVSTNDDISSVREEVLYYLSSVQGASEASSINSWIIIVLTLINSIVGGYLFFKNKNVEKNKA